MPIRKPLQKKIPFPTTNTCAHTLTNSWYENIFQGLDTVIDDYNDYKITNDQQKSDQIQQRQHTINVIVHKDKTKSDLAIFCLLRVPVQ